MPFAIRRQNPAEEQVVLQLQADLLLGYNNSVIEFVPCTEYLVQVVSKELTESTERACSEGYCPFNKPDLPANPSRAFYKPFEYSGLLLYSDWPARHSGPNSNQPNWPAAARGYILLSVQVVGR
jgi:hypothetical protein